MSEVTESEDASRHRGAMLLIVTGEGLLLHHRDDKPGIAHPDCWAGFGGAVEPGETVTEALHREVAEETGLTISDPVFLTESVDREGDGRLVSLFYVCGDYQPGDIDLREGAGVAVHQIADLPGLKLTPFVRRAIEARLLPALAAGRDGGPVVGDVVIRDARPADAARIALVHVRSWQGAYRGLLPQAYLDGLDPAQRAAGWERSLATGSSRDGRDGVLVAEAAGTVLGFVAYGPSRDADLDPERVGEVAAIYLMPGAWGTGVGRRLMAVATGRLGEARFGEAVLWVLKPNERARRFYAAAGWAADGAAKTEEGPGFQFDEVRYRRSLPLSGTEAALSR